MIAVILGLSICIGYILVNGYDNITSQTFLCQGKSNRVVAYRNGEFVDYDIDEALAMKKSIPEYQYEICRNLSI